MKNKYSISETILMFFSLIYTKMFYKNARLVRRPFYIRGKARLQIGEGFTTGYYCRFDLLGEDNDNSKKLIIKRNCRIGDHVHIVASLRVEIGENCLMASNVFISDTSHGEYSEDTANCSPEIPPNDRPLYAQPIRIGKNVWIGENVCILKGVKIGDGCIVGANAVVTKDIPNDCIVAGSPAKIIRTYSRNSLKWERK